MIFSSNPVPSAIEFVSLLDKANSMLNDLASSDKFLHDISGTRLEPIVKDVLSECAIGTNFENTIELYGGIKFPDIVASRFYGVEVKTSIKNHWKSIGNSVLESTRVEDVERIYILFGKLAKPVQFKYRLYEECLSDIVVTHYPRYQIDMDLAKDKTIFSKMGIAYDDIRISQNPAAPIVDYYRKNLKPGENLWWLDSVSNKANNLIIKMWTNLSKDEKTQLSAKAMALFPDIFGNAGKKYGQIALWLISDESIICPNIRDMFSAKGTDDVVLSGRVFKSVPRILVNLYLYMPIIKDIIENTSCEEFSHYWGIKTKEKNKFGTWLNLVFDNASKIQFKTRFDLMVFLRLATA